VLNKYAQQLNHKRKQFQDQINSEKTADQQVELRRSKTKLANVCITR